MENGATFLDTELTLRGFIRDLRAFLDLSEDRLRAISEIGDQADGFTGPQQTLTLQRRLGIPAEEAGDHLTMAQHLYNRVDVLGLDVLEAVNQIVSIVSMIEDPISIDAAKRDAVAEVLSVKSGYEVDKARRRALAHVPHFVNLNGSWEHQGSANAGRRNSESSCCRPQHCVARRTRGNPRNAFADG